VSYGLTAGLLKDVLPVDASAATIRNHLHKVALRQEAELGDERPGFVEGNSVNGKGLPMPEGFCQLSGQNTIACMFGTSRKPNILCFCPES
jgi:hypothetical protein